MLAVGDVGQGVLGDGDQRVVSMETQSVLVKTQERRRPASLHPLLSISLSPSLNLSRHLSLSLSLSLSLFCVCGRTTASPLGASELADLSFCPSLSQSLSSSLSLSPLSSLRIRTFR